MLNKIEVRYKCSCMKEEAKVLVPYRRDDENVIEWMDRCVQPSLYLDHRERSPLCKAETMEYAKLPAPENAPYIGGKPEVN